MDDNWVIFVDSLSSWVRSVWASEKFKNRTKILHRENVILYSFPFLSQSIWLRSYANDVVKDVLNTSSRVSNPVEHSGDKSHQSALSSRRFCRTRGAGGGSGTGRRGDRTFITTSAIRRSSTPWIQFPHLSSAITVVSFYGYPYYYNFHPIYSRPGPFRGGALDDLRPSRTYVLLNLKRCDAKIYSVLHGMELPVVCSRVRAPWGWSIMAGRGHL